MKLKQLSDINLKIEQPNIILEINANIKIILREILKIQEDDITSINKEQVKELLGRADLIITECHTTEQFKTRKNEKFNRLVYEFQRLNIKYESYQTKQLLNNIKGEFKEIKSNQENIKNETNNLVYNILGFIASFSVVSAAVAAIGNINSMSGILLFMAFSVFLLLTTLIGLHNFYKGKGKSKNKLQDNYFLWKMMLGVIVLLVIYKGVVYVRENQKDIFESIGRGIEQVRQNAEK